jgi:hypothetical protein
MSDSEGSVSPSRLRLGLAGAFVVAILAAQFSGATAPALGLESSFDVKAAIIGVFVVLLGTLHVTHAGKFSNKFGDELEPTDLQRAGAVIALGGLVVLGSAFL